MTLLLTEVSRNGIAMVADSAVTDPVTGHVRTDGTKVFAVPHLNAAVGMWGSLGIDPEGWMKGLLQRSQSDCTTVEELAHKIEIELSVKIPGMRPYASPSGPVGSVGIHLAGYDKSQFPTMWHIHNGVSETRSKMEQWGYVSTTPFDPNRVNANNDLPRQYVEDSWTKAPPGVNVAYYLTRNGDYLLLAWFQSLVDPLLRMMDPIRGGAGLPTGKGSIIFPAGSTPMDRAKFLAWQIEAISSLYGYSNVTTVLGIEAPHIGGELKGIAFGPSDVPAQVIVHPATPPLP